MSAIKNISNKTACKFWERCEKKHDSNVECKTKGNIIEFAIFQVWFTYLIKTLYHNIALEGNVKPF